MIQVVLWGVIATLALAALLPFLNRPLGIVRVPDFLRLQLLALSALLAPVVFFHSMPGAVVLSLVSAIHAAHVMKFTPLWPQQSRDAAADFDPERSISILSVNVKQSNREYARLHHLIRDISPDVVLAIEVDHGWVASLEDAHGEAYPHRVKLPQDNTYGLCLLSRFALEEVEVRDLVTEGIPSIRAMLTLPGGDRIRLYGIHPEPPIVHHDTAGRDSEIAFVGLEAEKARVPVIVAGDLNDVAWSSTTRRFQRLSGLCDPRVGRGLFNTFHASYPLLRWPLDHLFHSTHFCLVEMRRLPDIGSDHFPIFFRLALVGRTQDARPVEDADAEERGEVISMIRSERARDRDPIGKDWEDG